MSHIVSYYREKYLGGDLKILVRDFDLVISLILRNLKTKGEKTRFLSMFGDKRRKYPREKRQIPSQFSKQTKD